MGPLVHHVILFGCLGPQPDEGVVFDCFYQGTDCNMYLTGWVSGSAEVLPAALGLLICHFQQLACSG
jgi:hypothetical protein